MRRLTSYLSPLRAVNVGGQGAVSTQERRAALTNTSDRSCERPVCADRLILRFRAGGVEHH
ncbi:MAG: hypothetical protein HY763_04745 [Planctomycetes bacterium]|nr:hypothetical protein [Planctomycetota bacterium]